MGYDDIRFIQYTECVQCIDKRQTTNCMALRKTTVRLYLKHYYMLWIWRWSSINLNPNILTPDKSTQLSWIVLNDTFNTSDTHWMHTCTRTAHTHKHIKFYSFFSLLIVHYYHCLFQAVLFDSFSACIGLVAHMRCQCDHSNPLKMRGFHQCNAISIQWALLMDHIVQAFNGWFCSASNKMVNRRHYKIQKIFQENAITVVCVWCE